MRKTRRVRFICVGMVGGREYTAMATSAGSARRKIVRSASKRLQGKRVDFCGRTFATVPKTTFPTIADVEVSAEGEFVGRLPRPDVRRYIKRKKDPRFARFPK